MGNVISLKFKGISVLPKQDVLDSQDFSSLEDLDRLMDNGIVEGNILMTQRAYYKYADMLEPRVISSNVESGYVG